MLKPTGPLESQEASGWILCKPHHKAGRPRPKLFAQARSHHFALLFLARQRRLNPCGAWDGASVLWVLSVGTPARSKSFGGAQADRMAEDGQTDGRTGKLCPHLVLELWYKWCKKVKHGEIIFNSSIFSLLRLVRNSGKVNFGASWTGSALHSNTKTGKVPLILLAPCMFTVC